MFSVLCTPGYMNENSGTQAISFHPPGLMAVNACFHVSMLGKDSVYMLHCKVPLVLRELFLFLLPLAEASHRLPFCARFPRY